MDLRSKRVLVTGGAGFLGRSVVQRLHRLGCVDVIVPRKSDYDLTRPANVERLFADFRPEVVLHLAATSGGSGEVRTNPGTYLYQNALMGLQVIETARQFEVAKLVQVGSLCGYPKQTPVPFKEEQLWNGYPEATNAPYGLAKKLLMVQLEAYRQQFGFNGVSLLLANLYGPRDNFTRQTAHVIPAIIRQVTAALEHGLPSVSLAGTALATREFLYVDDAARAICLAAERVETSEPINIGTGHEIALRDLAELIADKLGYHGQLVFDAHPLDGQPRRSLDCSKAYKLFGYRSEVALSAGLDRTIVWYRQACRVARAA